MPTPRALARHLHVGVCFHSRRTSLEGLSVNWVTRKPTFSWGTNLMEPQRRKESETSFSIVAGSHLYEIEICVRL